MKRSLTTRVLSFFLATLMIGLGFLENGAIVSAKVNVDIGEEINAGTNDSKSEALALAKQYISLMAFSRQGLIDQLEYHGFTTAAATYGADNCGANWNTQAVKKAQSYLKSSAFSYQGLYDQLIFEKFTESQAKYGVDHCGADWFEQAYKKAQSYMKTFPNYTRADLRRQLSFEGFTDDQVEYAVGMIFPTCKVHTWGAWTVTVSNTAYSDGERVRTCSVCGDEQVETIPHISNVLKLTNSTDGIIVEWSEVPYNDGYHVYRKEEDGSFAFVKEVFSETSFTDKTAKTGKTYTYCVYAEFNSLKAPAGIEKTIVSYPFNDVSASASYSKALLWAYNNNIVGGTSKTTFSPNNNCTRQEFAAMLWKLNGKQSTASMSNPFTDVADTSSFRNPIVWCFNKGIVAGTSSTTFSPKDNITRWQIMAMLWRMVGKPKPTLTSNPFTDVKTTAAYYKAALWAYEKGITSVKTFKPNDNCTRWQLVVFLYKVNQIYGYIK